jgi:FkbM family methyltransferase
MATLLGPRRLARLEAVAQVAQGKGYGSVPAEEAAAVRQLLGSAAAGPLVVLDVGANVGLWTLEALDALPNATIHSFEPSSAAFAQLTSKAASKSRVSMHELALSDADGEATLYAPEPGSVVGSLTEPPESRRNEFPSEQMARTATLESWSRSAGLGAVDVLKLDVEGHEMRILRGAGRVLDSIQVIQFEFGPWHVYERVFFRDFWDLLTAEGYRLYRLGPGGLSALDEYSERDEVFLPTNYFASRNAL